jgi:hypothetical protein
VSGVAVDQGIEGNGLLIHDVVDRLRAHAAGGAGLGLGATKHVR